MTKITKQRVQKNKIGLTGHQVVSDITGYSLRYVSKLITEKSTNKAANIIKNEAEIYQKFQQGYINRRKSELFANI